MANLLSNYIRIKDVLVCDGNDIFLHFVIDKYIQILHELLDTKEISYKLRCLNIQVMHCNEFDITTCVLIHRTIVHTGIYNT